LQQIFSFAGLNQNQIMGLFDPVAWAGLFSVEGIVMLLSLSVLEIVLGIDNIIFISIVAGKLPRSSQKRARMIGLSLALIFRVMLLSVISWIAGLKEPLLQIGDFGASGRDLILFAGGLFLTVKTIMEIAEKIRHDEASPDGSGATAIGFSKAIVQIVLLDIVFSFDSILTAVAISSNLVIMVLAVVIAILIMIVFAGVVSDFINKYQTIKMLALVFLVAIGLVLIFESLHFEQNYPEVHLKNYVYVAMAFSLTVESLNLLRTRAAARRTREAHKNQSTL
jgi:predicted tellurium resistance membrane protein TerC